MKGKLVLAMSLTFVLMGMLGVALKVQRVEASGTIYIRANGSIDPLTANITSLNNITYTFTDNINDSIVVERNNIVLDGAGYTLQGTGSGTGISLSGTSNVTIKNMEIKAFRYGIWIYNLSNNNNISGNNITNNDDGIRLETGSNTIISGNNIANNDCGIRLWTPNHIIYHNNFVDNIEQEHYELLVYNVWDDGYPSGGNYWSDYIATANDTYSGPFQNETGSDGIGDTPYVVNVTNADQYPLMQPYHGPVRNLNTGQSYPAIQEAINNASEGDRIFVLSGTYYEHVVVNKSVSLVGENKYNTIIDGKGTGTVVYITVDNVAISKFTIQNGVDYDGIYLYTSSGTIISGNTLTKNRNGIYPEDSINITISGNNITFNYDFGIYLRGISRNNTVSRNTITENFDFGIYLWDSPDNFVIDNTILDNGNGVYIRGSTGNIISDNMISTNDYYGIGLIDGSNGNIIYHNNILNNTVQAYDEGINTWDAGYPPGGNYWSNYTGVDSYYGPYQNETGSDGIGDTAHKIDASNQDNYPLMGMFSDFNATSEYHVQTVCNSSISDFQFNGTAIIFNVSGENGTTGFCRICIPTALMNVTYKVFVNGTEVPHTLLLFSNSTHSYLYFTYDHSTQEVVIVPEFPTWTSMLLILIVLTLAIAIIKRRLLKTPNQ